MIHMRHFNRFEENNLKFLTQKNIEYTLVQITETGYKKSILDATDPMRQYFKTVGMHDYSLQLQGQENKVIKSTTILDETSMYPTSTSFYRPETKKGDPRVWTNNLKKHCVPNDILLMLYYKEKLYVVNLTQVDIEKAYNSAIITPLKDLINDINAETMSVSNELTGLLRDIAKEWHPAEVLADTGLGRAIESILGIEMNSSKQPDYKGIELKSYREKRPGVRATLFTQVPDWKNSQMKSAKEIVAKYGYMRPNKEGQLVKTYQNTISCVAPNSQNLGMTLYPMEDILAIEEKKAKKDKTDVIKYLKAADIALWQLPVLHQRLLEKHHETFWIEVESKVDGNQELFRPILVEHTKNPVVSQFDNLLDAGYITVDLLLSRPSGNGDTISFKMKKQTRPLLFPENEQINLRL
jgi:hypothetical protein